MTKEENEYVRTLNLSPEMEALVKHPTYTDLWGVVNNWTNIDEGWYPMRRYKYLSRIHDINIQRKNIRRFTDLGYKGAFHLLLVIKKKSLKNIHPLGELIYTCKMIQPGIFFQVQSTCTFFQVQT